MKMDMDMDIRKVYEIQAGHSYMVRTGFTQQDSTNADAWISRFGCLAAYLGWSHVIEEADEDSAVFEVLKNMAPNDHEYQNLTAWYEIAGLVASNSAPIKMG